jgi:hypothetical protein
MGNETKNTLKIANTATETLATIPGRLHSNGTAPRKRLVMEPATPNTSPLFDSPATMVNEFVVATFNTAKPTERV